MVIRPLVCALIGLLTQRTNYVILEMHIQGYIVERLIRKLLFAAAVLTGQAIIFSESVEKNGFPKDRTPFIVFRDGVLSIVCISVGYMGGYLIDFFRSKNTLQ